MCFQTWFKNRRAKDKKTGHSIAYIRNQLTSEQRGILEDFYSHTHYPNDEDVQVLMRLTNLTYENVQVCVMKRNKFLFE